MDKFTPQQFADSVRTAIGTVDHLFTQLDQLDAALRTSLTSEPQPLSVLTTTTTRRCKRSQYFRKNRFDYCALYKANADDSEEDPEEEDELETDLDADDETEKTSKKKKVIEFMPGDPLLAVRTLVYDPKLPDGLQPHIFYAALTDWRCGSKLTTPKAGASFRLRRSMSWRILRAIDHRTSIPPDKRLHTNAIVVGRGSGAKNVERRLSARLLGPIRSVKLYDLDGTNAVGQLAADMKAHWQRHATTSATA